MLNVLTVLIYALIVLVAIILVALILVQPSKSGGFGSAFGGLGESVFGAQAMSHISKLTVYLIAVFFILTLTLAVISGHSGEKSGKSSVLAQAAVTPVAPAAVEKKAVQEVKKDVPAKPVPAAKKDVPAKPAPAVKKDVPAKPVPAAKKDVPAKPAPSAKKDVPAKKVDQPAKK